MGKFDHSSEIRVGILGAGVIGMSCAVELQKKIPNAEIEVVAECFSSDTTSNGAAGVFRPGLQFRGPTLKITKKWLSDSYDFYNEMLINDPVGAHNAGVTRLPGYSLATNSPHIARNFFMEEILPDFRLCSKSELDSIPSDIHHKYGSFCTTILTSCNRYLPYLTRIFESNGGSLHKKRVSSFDELALENYDLVMNCTGLGAQRLCNDHTVTPIRGQVFKVKAPWIKNFYISDYDTYIYPSQDSVTLGCTRQFDSYNTDVDKYDSMSIWDRCTKLMPSLKDAKIIKEWVGLRPYRSTIRIEKEILKLSNGSSLKMVHNYGHGGYGVMSAPGTSKYAVEIAMQLLDPIITSKL